MNVAFDYGFRFPSPIAFDFAFAISWSHRAFAALRLHPPPPLGVQYTILQPACIYQVLTAQQHRSELTYTMICSPFISHIRNHFSFCAVDQSKCDRAQDEMMESTSSFKRRTGNGSPISLTPNASGSHIVLPFLGFRRTRPSR
jgi:hypothetical protein